MELELLILISVLINPATQPANVQQASDRDEPQLVLMEIRIIRTSLSFPHHVQSPN
jgi:hypothetical protein